MKSLIKFAILIVILAIFAFSGNPTITKVRDFTTKNGKILYEKAVVKIDNSKNIL